MKLDTTITDRNYLYGRLLAVADRIESQVSGHDSNRLTNAKRYMTAVFTASIPDMEDCGRADHSIPEQIIQKRSGQIPGSDR